MDYSPRIKYLQPTCHVGELKLWNSFYLEFIPELSVLAKLYFSRMRVGDVPGSHKSDEEYRIGNGAESPELLENNRASIADQDHEHENELSSQKISLTNTIKVNFEEFHENKVQKQQQKQQAAYNREKFMPQSKMCQSEIFIDVHQEDPPIEEEEEEQNISNLTEFLGNSNTEQFNRTGGILSNEDLAVFSRQNSAGTNGSASGNTNIDASEPGVEKLLTEKLLYEATKDIVPSNRTSKKSGQNRQSSINGSNGNLSKLIGHSHGHGGHGNSLSKKTTKTISASACFEEFSIETLKANYRKKLMAVDCMEVSVMSESFCQLEMKYVNHIRSHLLDSILTNNLEELGLSIGGIHDTRIS